MLEEVRCPYCKKMLGRISALAELCCQGCGAILQLEPDGAVRRVVRRPYRKTRQERLERRES